MFSYPLQLHPCRASIGNILKWRPASSSSPTRSTPLTPLAHRANDKPMSDIRFALITTMIIIASYAVAMTVSSLERVLAYVGSTGSTSISFILPGLFYWRISKPGSTANRIVQYGDDSDDEDEDEESGVLEGHEKWQKTWLRNAAFALMVYGIIVMITCLTMNIFFQAGGH